MAAKKQQWFISAGAAMLIAAAFAALPYLGFTWLGAIFLPGAFLAAIIFPQGIHGDAPAVFIVLAFIFTAALITPFVFLAQRWWFGRKEAHEALPTGSK